MNKAKKTMNIQQKKHIVEQNEENVSSYCEIVRVKVRRENKNGKNAAKEKQE